MIAPNGNTNVVALDHSTLISEIGVDFVYEIADKFLSEKAEKAFQLTFDDRNELSALKHQVKFGRYDDTKASPRGFLDFIGRKRIASWKALGDMTADEAKQEFVRRIHRLCPLFQTYLEAFCRNSCPPSIQNSTNRSTETPENTHKLKDETSVTEFLLKNEAEIRLALNAQTKQQFESYAARQFPSDVDKQLELIKCLQDRHFHEYVSYLRHELALNALVNNGSQVSISTDQDNGRTAQVVSTNQVNCTHSQDNTTTPQRVESVTESKSTATPLSADHSAGPVSPEEVCADEHTESDSGSLLVTTPVMWTREDVQAVKQLLANSNESVVRIGSGEVITIRVPTVPLGTRIFWEFVTDDYDIAFGLYFEWPHVNEPSSKPADDASSKVEATKDSTANVTIDELVPVNRRNSHLEVHCGSHLYPGLGTYLFKFDNSYSLWRAKTLYYRMLYAS